jgi:hypothetical protein
LPLARFTTSHLPALYTTKILGVIRVQKVIKTTPTTAMNQRRSCRTERGRYKKEEMWLKWAWLKYIQYRWVEFLQGVSRPQ